MEQIRSFIAIELPGEIKAALTRFQLRLKSGEHSYVKWVDPDTIHLTLKFLGNIQADKTDEIAAAIAAGSRGIPPFRLELAQPGAFPNLNRVQVIWVGIEGDLASLQHLQQSIESALKPLGFPGESRPFRAHLTLARLRDQATPQQRQDLGRNIAGADLKTTDGFTVDAVSLMRSQLTQQGAVHNRLNTVRLTPGKRQS